jgi:hypothetical protein
MNIFTIPSNCIKGLVDTKYFISRQIGCTQIPQLPCQAFFFLLSVFTSWKFAMTKPVQFMGILRSLSDACARSHKAIWSNCKNSQLPAGKAIQPQQQQQSPCSRYHFSHKKQKLLSESGCVLMAKVKKVRRIKRERIRTRHLVPAARRCLHFGLYVCACDASMPLSP